MLKLTFVAAAVIMLPTVALADRTIVSPSGYTSPSSYNGELFQALSHRPTTLAIVDAGTNDAQFELAEAARPNINRLSLSVQALLLPETFVTPSVSVGVRDVSNSSGDFASDGFYGRGFYLVVSKGLDNSVVPPSIHGVILTAGVGAGSFHGFFGGAQTYLPLHLQGTAEFDSRRMNYRLSLPCTRYAQLSFDRISASSFLSFALHTDVSL